MDLHAGEPSLFRQGGAGGEALDHLGDVAVSHRLRFSEHLRKPTKIQCHRRWRQGLLTQIGHGLAAGVVELDPELRATGPANGRPLTKTLKVLLVFQDHAAGTGHGTPVDHHVAGEQ